MKAKWKLCDPFLDDEFGTLSCATNKSGEDINVNWMSRLVRYENSGTVFYIKIYASRGRGLRRWLGRSRLRAEWENLELFASFGIPTAEIVAYGEKVLGTYQGAIVTRGLVGSRDLAILAQEGSPLLDDRRWRLAVIYELSQSVHTLHSAGFIHGDLKWRNILVDVNNGVDKEIPTVYLIDCPMGRMLWGPMRTRGIIKDLACLDKMAKYNLTRTDRLRFYLAYAGIDRLQANDKRIIRKVLRFFTGRD